MPTTRTRRTRRKKEYDPLAILRDIHGRWANAVFTLKDADKALKIRHEADPILDHNPEYRESVPIDIGKSAFIDWKPFINYPETPFTE